MTPPASPGGQLIDLLLFEMALHSYRGVMGCTHGRTYAAMIKGGRGENTASDRQR